VHEGPAIEELIAEEPDPELEQELRRSLDGLEEELLDHPAYNPLLARLLHR